MIKKSGSLRNRVGCEINQLINDTNRSNNKQYYLNIILLHFTTLIKSEIENTKRTAIERDEHENIGRLDILEQLITKVNEK